jgi:hypothetical protein
VSSGDSRMIVQGGDSFDLAKGGLPDHAGG